MTTSHGAGNAPARLCARKPKSRCVIGKSSSNSVTAITALRNRMKVSD